MKRRLKWAALLLALVAMVALVACDDEKEAEAEKSETTITEVDKTEAASNETVSAESLSETEMAETGGAKTEEANTEMIESEPPHEHTWSEWMKDKDATCTEKGREQRKCDCGERESREIETKGHQMLNGKCKICQRTPSAGLEYKSNGNATCSVVGLGACTDVDIIIPENSPDGDKVISIGKSAFSDCKSILSVEIPESVRIIEDRAFFYCIGLTSIKIPESVQIIEDMAFAGCKSLESIEIPNSTFDIGLYAFGLCTSLSRIVVDDKNPYYHDSGNCLIETETKTLIQGSNSSVIPSDGSVKNIAERAFNNCINLDSIEIPESVTCISQGAFAMCNGLSNITVADGNPIYHDDGNCIIETDTQILIVGCKDSTIPTDGSVKKIGDYAFWACASLENIVIPNNVTEIGFMAFNECSGLKNINIPESVTSIEAHAFSNCTALININVPYSVKRIGMYAFGGCTSLESVELSDNVLSIEEGVFAGCINLKNIELPDQVTSIGWFAFNGCTSLATVEIPDTVRSIGSYAFFDCESLADIIFRGTKNQWNTIKTAQSWNENTGPYSVHCTDGDITKSES